jgi:predicted dehydrogenase
MVEFVLDDHVARLSARFSTVFEPRTNEDTALVQFETSGGAIGSVVVSQASHGRKNALTVELSGTAGTGRFDQEQPGSLWVGRRGESTIISADPTVLDPDAARHVMVPPGHPQGYLDCVDRFITDSYTAIQGEPAPDGLPTFGDGRRAVRITECAILSASSNGVWVEVEG